MLSVTNDEMTEKPMHEENSRTALTDYAAESNKSEKLPQIQAALLGKFIIIKFILN